MLIQTKFSFIVKTIDFNIIILHNTSISWKVVSSTCTNTMYIFLLKISQLHFILRSFQQNSNCSFKKRIGVLIFLISRLLAPKWRENKVSVAKISKTIQKKGKSIKVLSFVFFVLIDDDMSKEMSTKIAPIAILLERSDNDFLYIRHKGYF